MRLRAGFSILAVAFACGDDAEGTTTSDGTESSTDASATTTVSSATATSTTTASSTSDDATSSPTTSGASTSTSADTTSDSAADTSTTEASTTTTADESSDSTGADGNLVLDPDTLVFFDLPIDSIRYAVGGQDIDSDTCVTLVWFYGGFAEPFEETCAEDGMDSWPYVIVTPGAQAPCTDWDYQPNVTTNDATGCVQFIQGMPLSGVVDVTVDVSGAPYNGTIVVQGP